MHSAVVRSDVQQHSNHQLCVSNASISILKKITSISFLVIKAARIGKAIDLNCKSLGLASLVSAGKRFDILQLFARVQSSF